MLKLIFLNLWLQVTNFVEELCVAWRYYTKSWRYCKLDLALLYAYFPRSPYEISKQFLKSRQEADIYRYGETPLTTLALIAKECGITAKDTLFELGCGRGRGCFWLEQFIGCHVVGIDEIPEFIEKAKGIQHSHVEFRNENFLLSDLKRATVIYLYGTCLPDPAIQQFVEKCSSLSSGTRIITVSYPLTDYNSALFEVMKVFRVSFPWGKADVYLQLRK